jgi:tetratricopeptide (TPR) repeat protein
VPIASAAAASPAVPVASGFPLPGQGAPGAKLSPPAKVAAKPALDAELDDALADDSDEGEIRDAGAAPVSYENRRKAEKIFEQAERDAAAGRFAGARMNAKLAMIYDPSLVRYRELYELWGSPAVQNANPASLRKDVALFQQAKDLELKGDYKGAVRLLEQALKMNPKGAPILNLLGVIQATRLKEYGKACDNITKACELEPSNRSFKNNLVKVLGMAEDVRDKRVVENDDGSAIKVKKMRPKLF